MEINGELFQGILKIGKYFTYI